MLCPKSIRLRVLPIGVESILELEGWHAYWRKITASMRKCTQTNWNWKTPAILETISVVSLPLNASVIQWVSPVRYASSHRLIADLSAVNLGKWVLRFLFARLIEEEFTRDAKFRKDLMADTSKTSSKPDSIQRENAPSSIKLPVISRQESQDLMNEDDTLITPRPTNSNMMPPMTPGLGIGAATPTLNGAVNNNRPSIAEEGTVLEKRTSQLSQPRTSTERSGDYFASGSQPKSPTDGMRTLGESSLDTATQSPVEGDKEEKSKESSSLFSKSFRMKFPKKLGRTSTDVKPAVVDEKSEESDKSEEKEDKTIQDGFFGSIQKIRYDYEERAQNEPSQHLPSGITPSSLSETPMLEPPPYTTVIIQDERPDLGGVADLYRGTISSVGQDADLIEKVAPMWLSDLLLKVSFAFPKMNTAAIADLDRTKCLRKISQRSLLYCCLTKISCQALQVLTGKSSCHWMQEERH